LNYDRDLVESELNIQLESSKQLIFTTNDVGNIRTAVRHCVVRRWVVVVSIIIVFGGDFMKLLLVDPFFLSWMSNQIFWKTILLPGKHHGILAAKHPFSWILDFTVRYSMHC